MVNSYPHTELRGRSWRLFKVLHDDVLFVRGSKTFVASVSFLMDSADLQTPDELKDALSTLRRLGMIAFRYERDAVSVTTLMGFDSFQQTEDALCTKRS